MPKRKSRLRNPIACSPLMRKGGAHAESKTGQRVRQRLSTYNAVNEWTQEVEVAKLEGENGGKRSPIFFSAKNRLINK